MLVLFALFLHKKRIIIVEMSPHAVAFFSFCFRKSNT